MKRKPQLEKYLIAAGAVIGGLSILVLIWFLSQNSETAVIGLLAYVMYGSIVLACFLAPFALMAALAYYGIASLRRPERKKQLHYVLGDDGEIMEVIDDNQDKILGDENEATR